MNLPRKTRDRLRRYGLALALAGVALFTRRVLPVREGQTIYQLPLTAVVLSGWFGGRGPGLFAFGLCATGILYWLIPPADSFTLPPEYTLAFCLFVALSLLLVEFSAVRFRVERALQDSERRFRVIAETVPEILWMESVTPRAILYVSPRYEQIWGRPLRDLERDPRLWIEAVHPEDREAAISAHERWLAGEGTDRYDVTYRIIRPDGGTRWIHARGTLIRDENGEPYRATGIAEDVTEEKRAQEALAHTQAELAHVARLTTMGQLAASIAHEVNQPLAAIGMSSSACLHWLSREPLNLEKVREILASIGEEATRAAEVMTRVRALTRKTPPHRERVDVNKTIREVIALARIEAEKGGVALQARLSPDVPPVLADRVQLQQVLLNLIINGIEAIGAAPDGPRELVIGSAKEVPSGVLVTVRDSGVGLNGGPTQRLFDPFYTTKPSGLGMGLAISRSIIELHGGSIWATPNTPRGAVFQFTLPVGAASQAPAGS